MTGMTRQAVAAGASLINDVWELQRDSALAAVAAKTRVPLVLMHNQAGTEYRDLLPDVLASLQESIDVATAAAVPSTLSSGGSPPSTWLAT